VPKTFPFDTRAKQYDDWFERHKAAYLSELLAVRTFLPHQGQGLEIGVGTGRFAGPLGIKIGLDPSMKMLVRAQKQGIQVLAGIAEQLPFSDEAFDYVLIVVTICYVDDLTATLSEIRRILKYGGSIIIGFLDYGSKLGRAHLDQEAQKFFYLDAHFFSAEEVEAYLKKSGFNEFSWGQTLFRAPSFIEQIDPIKPGHGEGLFAVVRAEKPNTKRNSR